MQTPAIIPDRLALLSDVALQMGSHDGPHEGFCAMELVAFVTGETWTDRPDCVCPTLGAFVRAWNDALPDGTRDEILKPFLARLVGTRGSAALAERRGYMAADWLVRTHTPAWLRLAGCAAPADALEALPEIVDEAGFEAAQPALDAARSEAGAALDAADVFAAGESYRGPWVVAQHEAWKASTTEAPAAPRSAAMAAIMASAWLTAWEAANLAAADAAWADAWTAQKAVAGDDFGTTARKRLCPVQESLRATYGELLTRMIEAGEPAAAQEGAPA